MGRNKKKKKLGRGQKGYGELGRWIRPLHSIKQKRLNLKYTLGEKL